ncbi:MAG: 50S ribosomal protein L21e [Candidatus Syntrophoarchaeum sp. GoM_oil]|nr:MAG: 50S ribosomal protein L21e [Candidatus Syntrophoarchaeum sp. GoM_oil]
MPVSHGVKHKTRQKLRKKVRERGLSPITRAVQEFEPGVRVHIKIDPSVHRGMPNPKFHGKTAKVLAMRGRSFRLEVKDGNKIKEIFVRPEHLLPQN